MVGRLQSSVSTRAQLAIRPDEKVEKEMRCSLFKTSIAQSQPRPQVYSRPQFLYQYRDRQGHLEGNQPLE